METEAFLFLAYMIVLGSAIGCISGLVPGIHVNTLAVLLLAAYPSLSLALSGDVCPSIVPILVASAVVSAAVVHSFMAFIPSVFLGSPGEEDVLSILPGHRMLMQGRGAEAVICSAQGSLVGAMAATILALPVHMMMGSGGWEVLQKHVPFILPVVMILLLLSERGADAARKRIWASFLCLGSAALGFITMYGTLPMTTGDGSLMLPLLAGLFGMPALLISLGGGHMPVQTGAARTSVDSGPALRGLLAGMAVGWLPGITATAGTVVASLGSPERTPERFIAMVSSVGTAATVFALVTLSVTGRGRTGTMLVVLDITDGSLEMMGFAMLLMAVAVSALIGYVATVRTGVLFSRILQGRELSNVNVAIALFLCVLTLVICGPGGLLLLLAATSLGLLPSAVGVGRVHMTSSLLIPVMISHSGTHFLISSIL